MSQTIKFYLVDNKKLIDPVLEEFLEKKRVELNVVDKGFDKNWELVTSQVMRGGKRFRPYLCRLSYELVGGKDREKILKAAAAVELIHQFLLIHDDIADNDEKRYGEKSLHEKMAEEVEKKTDKKVIHGKALAMGAGDLLYTSAYQLLRKSGFDAEQILESEELISKYLSQTVAGWSTQFKQLYEPIWQVTEEDYLRATRLVTAHYTVEGPMLVGSTLAGNATWNDLISEYAVNVGLAFQIQDDILGVFGETDKTGKPVGNDIREGKKTMLVIQAYEGASEKDKKFMEQKIGTKINEMELERFQEIMTQTGALDYTKKRAREYGENGVGAVEKLRGEIDSKVYIQLKLLAEYMTERSY